MSNFDELAARRSSSPSLPDQRDGESGPELDAAADRAAAAEDRRRAAADRQRAAEYLADAYRDEVTGTLNRRPGGQQMHAEIDRAHRASTPLAVIFVDIDGLKYVNDLYGHSRGDELLAATGTALRTSLRSYDVIVRYGGDEFVCALPGGTEETASESIDRARRALAELVPGATLSAGQALLRDGDSLDDVVRRADADLFRRRARVLMGGHGPADSVPGTARIVGDFTPTLACAACGVGIPLTEFTLDPASRTSRSADCGNCGETTLIQLAQPKG